MNDEENSVPSKKKTDLWPEERVAELVWLFRAHPVLWDVRLKAYKDRNQRHDAFMSLAKHFNVEKGEIEKKIANLRNTYLRDLKKENSSKKTGTGRDAVFVSNWFLFKEMGFLRDRYTPKGTVDTEGVSSLAADGDENSESEYHCDSHCPIETTEEIDVFNTSQEKTADEQSSASSISRDQSTENATEASTQKRSTIQALKKTDDVQKGKRLFVSPKKRAATCKRSPKGSTAEAVQNTVNMASEALTTMNNIFSKKQAATKRDELDIFGEQVTVKLRKLPDRARMIVQHKINTLIFHAEMDTLVPSPQPKSSWTYNSNPYPASRAYSEPSTPGSISNTFNYLHSSENSWSLPNSPAAANNWNLQNSPLSPTLSNVDAATKSSSDDIGASHFQYLS